MLPRQMFFRHEHRIAQARVYLTINVTPPLLNFLHADSSLVVGEYPVGGAAVLATRAAWALAEPPINTLALSNPGVLGAGAGRAYTAAFGGLSALGSTSESSSLAYYYPDSNSWVTQSQTGGTATALPVARQR